MDYVLALAGCFGCFCLHFISCSFQCISCQCISSSFPFTSIHSFHFPTTWLYQHISRPKSLFTTRFITVTTLFAEAWKWKQLKWIGNEWEANRTWLMRKKETSRRSLITTPKKLAPQKVGPLSLQTAFQSCIESYPVHLYVRSISAFYYHSVRIGWHLCFFFGEILAVLCFECGRWWVLSYKVAAELKEGCFKGNL